MARLNAKNERLKRSYLRWEKEARGKSEATLDALAKAIDRFEAFTRRKDFKAFHREQAIAFKRHLAATPSLRGDGPLSASTQAATLAALKEFLRWLACQPGFKSRINVADIDYFTPSNRDAATAKARKLKPFPSVEQIRATINAMPAETVVERRNRALIAFAILTGMRDRAMASLQMRHLDLLNKPPLVRQEPDVVRTKFAKSIITFFFPVGDDLARIVADWAAELSAVHLFGPTDPLFPCTRIIQDGGRYFMADGIDRKPWSNASPIRTIFRNAFEAAGVPYFPPHSFRHTLGHLMQTACRTPEQIKAWSQNLGHESVHTTFASYGTIDPWRQGEVMRGIGDG